MTNRFELIGGSPRQQVERLAQTQHGAFLRADAVDAGVTPAQIDRRVRRGQWVSGPERGTLVLASEVMQPLSALKAATLVADSVAWRQSALALWGLAEHPVIPVVVASRRRRGAGSEVVCREDAASLPVSTRFGVRSVPLELAIASMASVSSVQQVHALLDAALRDRRTTLDRFAEAVAVVGVGGRRGAGVLAAVVADRQVDRSVPLSAWSRLFVAKLAQAGVARPEMEYRVAGVNGKLIAQVDLAYPERRLAIELDSVAWHLNREAFERDRRRDGALAQAGWSVSRFTDEQCRAAWPWVVATIVAQLRNRGVT